MLLKFAKVPEENRKGVSIFISVFTAFTLSLPFSVQVFSWILLDYIIFFWNFYWTFKKVWLAALNGFSFFLPFFLLFNMWKHILRTNFHVWNGPFQHLFIFAGWFNTAVWWDDEGDNQCENCVWLLHIRRDLWTRFCKEEVSCLACVPPHSTFGNLIALVS